MRTVITMLCFLGIAMTLPCCSTLTLEQVDFAWPVESVLKVNSDNIVNEGRYAISFRVAGIASDQFADSLSLKGVSLRLLRSGEGYYFLTGPKFRHVYVLTPGASELTLRNRIEVSETGLKSPALNQRNPHVELLDGKSFKVLLTSDGIVEEKKQ